MRFAVEPAQLSAQGAALAEVTPFAGLQSFGTWADLVAAALPGRTSPVAAQLLEELVDQKVGELWRDLEELAHSSLQAASTYRALSGAAFDAASHARG